MIVSYGDALYRAVDAVEKLKRDGINVGLVNKVHLNAVDEAMMARLGAAKFVLIVEPLNKKTGPHAHGHARARSRRHACTLTLTNTHAYARTWPRMHAHSRACARAHTHARARTRTRAHTHTRTRATKQVSAAVSALCFWNAGIIQSLPCSRRTARAAAACGSTCTTRWHYCNATHNSY
jgi:hypothetical protein